MRSTITTLISNLSPLAEEEGNFSGKHDNSTARKRGSVDLSASPNDTPHDSGNKLPHFFFFFLH